MMKMKWGGYGMDDLDEVNILLAFLANNEAQSMDCFQADSMIIAGNSIPMLTQKAYQLAVSQQIKNVIFSGGFGHATNYLIKNLEKNDLGHFFDQGPYSEAELLKRVFENRTATQNFHFFIEKESTNTGENALFSLQVVNEKNLDFRKTILVQDPILQKRTKATFEHHWRKKATDFYCYNPFSPILISMSDPLQFKNPMMNGWWEKDYFYALILGEIARLIDDQDGYGPNGKGYIGHIAVPEEVEAAYKSVRQALPQYHR